MRDPVPAWNAFQPARTQRGRDAGRPPAARSGPGTVALTDRQADRTSGLVPFSPDRRVPVTARDTVPPLPDRPDPAGGSRKSRRLLSWTLVVTALAGGAATLRYEGPQGGPPPQVSFTADPSVQRLAPTAGSTKGASGHTGTAPPASVSAPKNDRAGTPPTSPGARESASTPRPAAASAPPAASALPAATALPLQSGATSPGVPVSQRPAERPTAAEPSTPTHPDEPHGPSPEPPTGGPGHASSDEPARPPGASWPPLLPSTDETR